MNMWRRELARLCKAEGVRRYVLASSCSIYDCGALDEGADVLQDEAAPVAPRAPYSLSKYDAEREVLPMAGEDFCPVALRKGTIYGYCPGCAMTVVTFVRTPHPPPAHAPPRREMWRLLVDVRDTAQAISPWSRRRTRRCGAKFNSATEPASPSSPSACMRRWAPGIDVDIRPDYHKGVRNYRVSGRKIEVALNFRPTISIEESVESMVRQIRQANVTDFDNPRYYNIRWISPRERSQGCGHPGRCSTPPTRLPQ
jgi:nucleoside-diphosphate-sugar epimerase